MSGGPGFYLERILAWYGDFNRVRNAAFRRMGLSNCGFLTPIPASTVSRAQGARFVRPRSPRDGAQAWQAS